VIDVNAPDAPHGIGVLLHPHPDFGGDRFHPFIDSLFHRLPEAGVAGLRFDFASADPSAASQQALAAVDTGTACWPGLPVVLAGYSFGAGIACGIDDERIAGWYLLAPQSSALDATGIGQDRRPKALVVPERDQFSPPAVIAGRVADWVATTVTVVPDADHFLGAVAPIVEGALNWVTTVVSR
jgi:alpha/beta superfamily hydrolase